MLLGTEAVTTNIALELTVFLNRIPELQFESRYGAGYTDNILWDFS
jgi:hypothetical protein